MDSWEILCICLTREKKFFRVSSASFLVCFYFESCMYEGDGREYEEEEEEVQSLQTLFLSSFYFILMSMYYFLSFFLSLFLALRVMNF